MPPTPERRVGGDAVGCSSVGMALGVSRSRTEQLLVGLIAVLTLWGIIMQVMVRSYVRQERSLTSGDEERLAEEIIALALALARTSP